MDRGLLFVAGLAGALGVALSAAGAHIAGAERLATAGATAMGEAPALLAIGFFAERGGRLLRLAGWTIALGLLLFAGALAFHDLSGSAGLAFLAPVGGTVMIAGWFGVAAAAFAARRA